MPVPSKEFIKELFAETSRGLGFEYKEPEKPKSDKTREEMKEILEKVAEIKAKSKFRNFID